MPNSLYKIIYDYAKSNTISITLLGHVDCGKSTIIGKLLYDKGAVTTKALNKIRKYAKEMGKDSFIWAFICDTLKEERERGITITGSTHSFKTESNACFIHDIHGHRDFIKNASKYIALADVGILIVSAARCEFEVSIAKGDHRRGEMTGTVRIHAQKCISVGVKQLIVCINKMDCQHYDMLRYKECKTELSTILQKMGYNLQNIVFIATSGWSGDNIRQKSMKMPWFKGFDIGLNKKGYTLYDALEYIVKVPVLNAKQTQQISGSGIVSIFKMYKFCDNFFLGKVERGSVRIGQKVLFHPKSGAIGIVKSIGMNDDNNIVYAEYGDCVGIKIEGLTKRIDKNDVMLCIPDVDDEDVLYPMISKQVKSFTATVMVLQHPNKLYCKGGRAHDVNRYYNPLVYVGTRRVTCQMIKIHWKINRWKKSKTVDDRELLPVFMCAGDKASIELVPKKPLLFTSLQQFEKYGRIVVHERSNIVMWGYITDVSM